MLQHWPYNVGPKTHASLCSPQEPPERHVVHHLHQKTPIGVTEVIRLAVLIRADTDVVIFEPSQVMSSKPCTINVDKLRVIGSGKATQYIVGPGQDCPG